MRVSHCVCLCEREGEREREREREAGNNNAFPPSRSIFNAPTSQNFPRNFPSMRWLRFWVMRCPRCPSRRGCRRRRRRRRCWRHLSTLNRITSWLPVPQPSQQQQQQPETSSAILAPTGSYFFSSCTVFQVWPWWALVEFWDSFKRSSA